MYRKIYGRKSQEKNNFSLIASTATM